VFPFDEAAIVEGAIDELAGTLAVVRNRHADAAATAVTDWAGSSRDRFDARVTELLEQLASLQRQAVWQREELEGERVAAGRARAERLDRTHEWQAARDRYDAGRRELFATGTRQQALGQMPR
jgi:hypothetical protein